MRFTIFELVISFNSQPENLELQRQIVGELAQSFSKCILIALEPVVVLIKCISDLPSETKYLRMGPKNLNFKTSSQGIFYFILQGIAVQFHVNWKSSERKKEIQITQSIKAGVQPKTLVSKFQCRQIRYLHGIPYYDNHISKQENSSLRLLDELSNQNLQEKIFDPSAHRTPIIIFKTLTNIGTFSKTWSR